ncbi:MAG TPA: S-layer homology domain-containing protein [Candidatus Acidoferrum sp.]|nr:S-layer homology domain-containing protein [Candidatus Acidoferrum sp.]
MRNTVKRGMAFILLFALVCGMLPAPMALDNEPVLTSIGHNETDSKSLSGSTRSVALTTRDFDTTEVDLSAGIDLRWGDAYTNVVASFTPGASTATVDGSAVQMTVAYSLESEAEPRPVYTTTYSIEVDARPYEEPEFSGTISKSALLPSVVHFASSDFEAKYTANDGNPIGGIRITGIIPSFGELKLGGKTYALGSLIEMDEVGTLTFEATDSGSVFYTVSAFESGETDDTDDPVGTGSIEIVITKVTPPTVKSAISKSVNALATLTFSAADFTGACDMNDGTLAEVEITPTGTGYGTWYAGSTAFNETRTFSASAISTLKFTGSAAGTATFSWRASNEAGYSGSGTGSIAVSYNVGDVTYTVNKNSKVTFSATAFNTVCAAATGANLSYVKFTLPSTSQGKLYYNYTSSSSYDAAVKATDQYYRSTNPSLSKVTFVPASGYTGTVTVNYTAWDVGDVTYTGKIVLTVKAVSVDTVTFETEKGETVVLDGDDFNDACEDAGFDTLDYIKINALPSSSAGKLYYNYTSDSNKGTSVATSTKLYYDTDDTPYLDKVAFVPASSYTGAVSINYTGYDEDGEVYSATFKIEVEDKDTDVDDVTFETDKGETVVFDGDEFNDVCEDANYETLNYIKIKALPSSSAGKLYYNYTSSSSKGTAVATSTKLYYDTDDTPYLDKVAFVPASSYTGTVSINYTGYDEDGESFAGIIKITVADDGDVDAVTFETDKGDTIVFDGDEFNEVCEDADYDTLDYIKIKSLPSSSAGKLYYNYTSDSSKGTSVTTSTKLYYDHDYTPYLDKVAFVPASSYTGTVSINYTGYDEDGESFTGVIKITVVDEGDVDAVTFETDKGDTIVFDGDEFNEVCEDADYETLDYIKIKSLPSSSAGKLYYNYTSDSSKGTSVTTSTKLYYDHDYTPYLDKVAFVPASSYTGTVTINYTGYDEDGESFTGVIKITVREDGDVDAVTYTADKNETVVFDGDDFNDVCEDADYETLNYIRIASLPSSSTGKLYYNYASSSSKGTAVTTSTKLYYDHDYTPYLDKVAFVPTSGYSGTVTINYTGYDEDGESFTGVIKIVYGAASDITYSTSNNLRATFSDADFNTVCKAETGDNLSYVKFSLPSSSSGALYYNYTAQGSYTSTVVANTAYYRSSSPYLSSVSFVPVYGYTGTVSIAYTGYSTDGDSFSGTVKVTVTGPKNSSYFTDVNTTYYWAVEAVDYLYGLGVVKGTGSSSYGPGSHITRGDFVLMLYRALGLSATTSGNFKDVAKGSYYYDAVAVAKALGIAQGSGDYFYPTNSLTRQDAMVFVYRALQAKKISITEGTSSDLSVFTDRSGISSYATISVATLVKANVIVGSGNKINPVGNLTRAEMAVILHRVLKK